MPHADPFEPLDQAVSDPLARRVLRGFCSHRRRNGVSLEDAVRNVVLAVKRGELVTLVAEAAKPIDVWREEQELSRLILRAVGPLRGAEFSPSAIGAVRTAVIDVCAVRYPKQARRYVSQVVKANVGFTLRRLEVRTPRLVEALAGLGRPS